jgi:hypothetical protein
VQSLRGAQERWRKAAHDASMRTAMANACKQAAEAMRKMPSCK